MSQQLSKAVQSFIAKRLERLLAPVFHRALRDCEITIVITVRPNTQEKEA